METLRLILFTTLWTGFWIFPLKPLPRALELVAGLLPFCTFGLRVFAGFLQPFLTVTRLEIL